MPEFSSSPYLPAGVPAPVPAPDGLDAPFWEGTLRGEILFQRCTDCGTLRSPEWICYRCHSFSVEWVPVSQRGSVYTWERVWNAAMPALKEALPYLVVLVELPGTKGLRLLGNLLGDPMQDVSIGAQVQAVFEPHEGFALVQWRMV